MSLYESRAEMLVMLSQKEIQDIVNEKRKTEMAKRIDYYEDKQLDYLDEILGKRFAKIDQLKLVKSSRNIIKRIVDKISLLYNSPPTRLLTNKNGKVNKKITNRVKEEIWNPGELDNVCSTAERLMNLCRTVGVKVSWRDDRIHYDIYAPDNLDVVQNAEDPTEADAIIYKKKLRKQTVSGKEVSTHIVWSNEEHFKLVGKFGGYQKVAIEGNPEMINPYGIIPFSWYRYDYAWRTFFNNGGEDLIDAQENLGVHLTDLNHMIKMQAYSIPVIKGDMPTTPLIIDATSPYFAESPDDSFHFETPNAQIKAVWDIIVEMVNCIATDYDIAPGSFTLTKAPTSGIALKLENVGLYERAWRKRTFALSFEMLLWEITKRVWNVRSPKNKIPEDLKLSVVFDDIAIPEDPIKEQQAWAWKFKWGTATPIDYIMATDPNLTREAAEEKYLENIGKNEELKTKFPSLADMFKAKAEGSKE